MSGPDLYVLTVGFLALKKPGFSEEKNSSPKFFFFFLPFFYATFQCGRYNVFKFYFIFIFAHKKLKKPPSKVAHNRPKPFFPQPSPSHSQQPKIDFSYHKNVPPDICSLICGKNGFENQSPFRNRTYKFYVTLLRSLFATLMLQLYVFLNPFENKHMV